MKETYKTFPNLPIFPLPWEDYTQLTEVVTQYECFIRDVLEWKENSQTELRERFEKIKSEEMRAFECFFIKEVLGEASFAVEGSRGG